MIENDSKYGFVKYHNKTVNLNQEAFYYGHGYYMATGIDDENNEYEIRWEIMDDVAEDETDESYMCHWDDYTVRKLPEEFGLQYKNNKLIEDN